MTTFSDRVRDHIRTWSAELPDRSFWPKFVYHFTDLQNAVSILQSDRLYSRKEAIKRNLVQVDSASRDVIAHTAPPHTRYARLYFRPRTPTQFRNEGIRTPDKIWAGAHCPVPVFLCFDTERVLTMVNTELSNGNMASGNVEYGPAAEMLGNIPFQYVFHNGSFTSDLRDTITFHRHAEVLVPDRLDLEPSLKLIVCRSPAERTTLLHLLSEAARHRWEKKVRIDYQTLFERKWTYVETVITIGADIELRFNQETSTPGPFAANLVYDEAGGGRRTWSGRMVAGRSPQRFTLERAQRGVATLTLDGHTAFSGPITFDDMPF